MIGPVEPTAAQRAGAHASFQLFVALLNEGFTESQALQILGTMLTAHIINPNKDDQ